MERSGTTLTPFSAWRGTIQSRVAQLSKLQFYDTINLPSNKPDGTKTVIKIVKNLLCFCRARQRTGKVSFFIVAVLPGQRQ